jgi:two-component system alkaline phosphatase synthesis response regulator PhoP
MAEIHKTIFIADDDDDLRQILVQVFEEEGYEVMQSADGEEVLQRALTQRPDFIILDIMMPSMNGSYVLERLRDDAWGATVPILMVSSMDTEEFKAKAEKYTAVGYLVKQESSPQDVVKMVKQHIGS